MTAIIVDNLSKTFHFKAQRGFKGFFSVEKKTVEAVSGVSFSVERGESLAFIGPNGAGKSTTIKILTGILQPTSGHISVLGMSPVKQRRELALRIGTVFGQRSQLIFNLPLEDSFQLTAAMYQVSRKVAQQRIASLTEQFSLYEFAEQPVRKLSLGQRMRAEVANALIHNPDIIFLDEPTIGLDIVAKRALRKVICSVNKEQKTTVFLTSHDVGDIEEVCDRTMIVNHGNIIFDAKTADIKENYLATKTVAVLRDEEFLTLPTVDGVTPVAKDGWLLFTVDTSVRKLAEFIAQVSRTITDAQDIVVKEPQLEDVIHDFYTAAKVNHVDS